MKNITIPKPSNAEIAISVMKIGIFRLMSMGFLPCFQALAMRLAATWMLVENWKSDPLEFDPPESLRWEAAVIKEHLQVVLCGVKLTTHPGALSVFYPPNQYKNRIDYPPPVINT